MHWRIGNSSCEPNVTMMLRMEMRWVIGDDGAGSDRSRKNQRSAWV
jgi:hypothetical protein